MNEVIIRHVLPTDLDECFLVETSGFPPEEAASRETIKLRLETFPQGFFVAEIKGRVIGILNSAAMDKDDISDEELKQLIGHDPHGKALLVKLWRFFECFPLLRVMTENHQPDMLPFDAIKQFNHTGADRFGVRVAAVVLLVTGEALAEGDSVNCQ